MIFGSTQRAQREYDMEAWPHQIQGVADVLAAFKAGGRRVCLTSPTGGGKTYMMENIARAYLDYDMKVVLYSHRKMLIEQVSKAMEQAGLDHGIRAAMHADNRHKNFQISSLATESARSSEAIFRRARKQGATREEAQLQAQIQAQRWEIHDADLVLVDEAHLHKSGFAKEILAKHHAKGACIAGITATPLGLAEIYDQLVIAGTVSELRQCGALLPCRIFGPDEPDMSKFKGLAAGKNLSEDKIAAIIGRGQILFGRVWEHWKRLNPDARPTILFASGVEESIWFAEEFTRRGVRWAHIDGQDVWVDGRLHRSNAGKRAEVLEDSKFGRIKGISNRYIFREGIDAPWLYHGVLATVIGSMQSYLQCVGRLLRAYPSMDEVILQDHGGHWWRHGSPNADRQWDLRYTNNIIASMRRERLTANPAEQPWRCRKCAAIMVGTVCRSCGWVLDPAKRSRPVVQTDGTLCELEGLIWRPQKTYAQPDAASKWKNMYFRARNSHMTFQQARNFFASLNYWRYPSRSLPFMPVDDFDLFRKVRDVETSRLIDSRFQ
jgi:superfamily II DNA or RNA helicase